MYFKRFYFNLQRELLTNKIQGAKDECKSTTKTYEEIYMIYAYIHTLDYFSNKPNN